MYAQDVPSDDQVFRPLGPFFPAAPSPELAWGVASPFQLLRIPAGWWGRTQTGGWSSVCAQLANSWMGCQGQARHRPWHWKPELRHLSLWSVSLRSWRGRPKVSPSRCAQLWTPSEPGLGWPPAPCPQSLGPLYLPKSDTHDQQQSSSQARSAGRGPAKWAGEAGATGQRLLGKSGTNSRPAPPPSPILDQDSTGPSLAGQSWGPWPEVALEIHRLRLPFPVCLGPGSPTTTTTPRSPSPPQGPSSLPPGRNEGVAMATDCR